MIRKSLGKFGPLRSLAGRINPETGEVEIKAGNGTFVEAGQLGIEKLRIVERNPNELVVVVADDLTDEQWEQYAVADNRTSDLSDWDKEQLQLTHDAVDLSDWFTEGEIKAWNEEDLPDEGDADTQEMPENWALLIHCEDEQRMNELMERFLEEGLECQALIS